MVEENSTYIDKQNGGVGVNRLIMWCVEVLTAGRWHQYSSFVGLP